MRRWLHYLRLAWSVMSLMGCLLVIALWTRSYWWLDYRGREFSSTSGIAVHSLQGQLRLTFISAPADTISQWPAEGTASFELFRETFALPNTPHRVPPEWIPDHSTLRKFEWTRYPDGVKFVAPYWFFAAVCGVLAGAPWIRRFSLRSMLVLMTLLAAFLGAVLLSS